MYSAFLVIRDKEALKCTLSSMYVYSLVHNPLMRVSYPFIQAYACPYLNMTKIKTGRENGVFLHLFLS